MKNVGYVLIVLGFLAGAYLSVQHPEEVSAPPFISALIAASLGVFFVRLAGHRMARQEDKLEARGHDIAESLRRLVENSERLDADRETAPTYGLRFRIDKEFRRDIDIFVEARESIAHRFGLQAYADVMNHFAAGERYLNRVWSASTDGYVDEAKIYISKAREQFTAAKARYGELSA
jgi:hypothetical protein